MLTSIRKWGNSQGLRLPKDLLGDARIAIGDQVEVTLVDNTIVIAPVKGRRGTLSLQELMAQIPDDYQVEELDWGPPVGKEVW